MADNPYLKTPFPEFEDLDHMQKKEVGDEAEALREAVEYHNNKYYIDSDPVISDKAFDTLFKRLQAIEDQFPEFDSDLSPTRKVGALKVDKLKKRKHQSMMLSLNASDKEEDIRDFWHSLNEASEDGKTTVVLEPKFDGLSVEVVYEKGSFSYAATRGDGEEGEDISENVKTIRSLPLKLRSGEDQPEHLVLRGEIFMTKKGFQKLNKDRIERSEKPFANPRNAAAGLIRQLDSKTVAGAPLDIFFYELMGDSANQFSSHWEVLRKLPKWGLKTNSEYRKGSKMDDIASFFRSLADKRASLPYEIDGVVIKADDLKLRQKLGSRDRSPRWAFAWKFEPRKEITTVIDIVVQVGRTGILTPVATLEPVNVGGVTVSRASLHNEEEVHKKDIRPGDTVRVERAGDVIPQIAGRVDKGKGKRPKKFSMPRRCPVCQTETVQEGAYVLCPNGLSCKAQVKGTISHYASRAGMNIEHLGEKTIGQLVDREMVSSLPDIYKLKKAELIDLDGFGQKSAKKLHNAIQGSKNPELDTFLYALGIRHIGRHTARLLADKFQTFDAIQDLNHSDLTALQDIGDEIADSVTHFFRNEDNQNMLKELKEQGVKVRRSEGEQSNQLKGKTFVLTGSLKNYTREEAKDAIETLGGRTTSSVSSRTDYLVLGENPGQKLDDARKDDVQIIDEEEFREILSD